MIREFNISYSNGIKKIPYTRAFKEYGQVWVLHRDERFMRGAQARQYWKISHYATGAAAIPYSQKRQDKAFEIFNGKMNEAGPQKIATAVSKLPIINTKQVKYVDYDRRY